MYDKLILYIENDLITWNLENSNLKQFEGRAVKAKIMNWNKQKMKIGHLQREVYNSNWASLKLYFEELYKSLWIINV